MSFSEIEIQNNNIVRNMGHLLSQIDPRVRWTDYIPADALHIGHSLVAIGMSNNKVKYVDVSEFFDTRYTACKKMTKDLSPFKLVNRVLNAMDDYHLEVQFLTNHQLSFVTEDIAKLAKDRALIAKQTADILRYENVDCAHIVYKAQELGIFPEFFPNQPDTEITGDMLADFIENCRATFIDTQIIAELVEEELEKTRMNGDTDYERG